MRTCLFSIETIIQFKEHEKVHKEEFIFSRIPRNYLDHNMRMYMLCNNKARVEKDSRCLKLKKRETKRHRTIESRELLLR